MKKYLNVHGGDSVYHYPPEADAHFYKDYLTGNVGVYPKAWKFSPTYLSKVLTTIKVINKDDLTGKAVAGAEYGWKDETNGFKRIRKVGKDGTFSIPGLSINRIYSIRQIKTPTGYKKDTNKYVVNLTGDYDNRTYTVTTKNRHN